MVTKYSKVFFIPLPQNFVDLAYKSSKLPCPLTGFMTEKIICLLCGEFLCHPGFCCGNVSSIDDIFGEHRCKSNPVGFE